MRSYSFNTPKTAENDLRKNVDTFEVSDFRKVLENYSDIVTKPGKAFIVGIFQELLAKV